MRRPNTWSVARGLSTYGPSLVNPRQDESYDSDSDVVIMEEAIPAANNVDMIILDSDCNSHSEFDSDTGSDDKIDEDCDHCMDKMTNLQQLKDTFQKYRNMAREKYDLVVQQRDDMAKKLAITQWKAKKLLEAYKKLDKK
nr:uncharacterized protein LOC117856384 [Setaria viridis]